MNGIQLAERLAELDPDLPILLTTGYNDDLSAADPDRGSLDVLGKPYRKTELTDRVRQALNGTAARERRKASDFGAAEA